MKLIDAMRACQPNQVISVPRLSQLGKFNYFMVAKRLRKEEEVTLLVQYPNGVGCGTLCLEFISREDFDVCGFPSTVKWQPILNIEPSAFSRQIGLDALKGLPRSLYIGGNLQIKGVTDVWVDTPSRIIRNYASGTVEVLLDCIGQASYRYDVAFVGIDHKVADNTGFVIFQKLEA